MVVEVCVHHWSVGSEILKDNEDDEGYYVGKCSRCADTRRWPAFLESAYKIVWTRGRKANSHGREMEE